MERRKNFPYTLVLETVIKSFVGFWKLRSWQFGLYFTAMFKKESTQKNSIKLERDKMNITVISCIINPKMEGIPIKITLKCKDIC